MTEDRWSALAELAARTTFHVDRAPGLIEKRLVLMRGFAEAHQIHDAVTDDPDLALIDTLLQRPDLLVRNLEEVWTRGMT
jgi:hypothetical protein